MKTYNKQCKNTKQINTFLRSIGLNDWEFDCDTFPVEFDFDGWINENETKGISILISPGYEVSVIKYTKKDIEELENELMN
jgi:hypothetical protein